MMEGNEDDWISGSEAIDESEDELILADNLRTESSEAAADDEFESDEEAEGFNFDPGLPVKHSYLGSNLQEARGHTLMDLEAPEAPLSDPGTSDVDSGVGTSTHGLYDRSRGQICQIPILPPYSGVSMALVPGQTLPMTLFHPQAISMLRVALQRGRTFGIVAIRNDSDDEDEERSAYFLSIRRNSSRSLPRRPINEDYPLWDVGTTAEIYEFQGDEGDTMMTPDENRVLCGFTLKAKGSQRFRLLSIHRQVDGNLLAKVQILPEVVLPHPLHECRITCLDRRRHELPANPKIQNFRDKALKRPYQGENQVNLVASICSLIKEKRKGDDTESWEKICEVKRLYDPNNVGSSPFKEVESVRVVEQQGQVFHVDTNKVVEAEGSKATESESSNSQSPSLLDGGRKKEVLTETGNSAVGATPIMTETEEKSGAQGHTATQKSTTIKEHLLGMGFLKGRLGDSKSFEEDPKVRRLSRRAPVDGRWCRKKDSALTAWPDWIYNLYDGETLVKRMHQEFKSLHLSKKRDRSLFVRSPMGFKCSDKGLDNSFPCLSEDPVELSFWVVQNLPLDDNQRVKLLRMNSAIQRLRWELGILEKCHRLKCCNCGQKIADQRNAFCMSVAGPQGTYVNPGGYVHEALTLSKARGLKVVTHPPSTEHSWFPGGSKHFLRPFFPAHSQWINSRTSE
ncbi:protein cereblon isoform X2 [Hetaerina americana]|uniref:protein cereblon isoform X2 n=1 Tax=Hetaerina americana TaxID=62018 RepID=UPI003A7F2345